MSDAPASFAPLAGLLREHAEEFRVLAQRRLYTRELQARQLFPMRDTDAHPQLAPSLAWVLERSTPGQRIPDEVLARMRRLGLDHRRHGFPAELYRDFGTVLTGALRELAQRHGSVDKQLLDAATTVVASVVSAMSFSARTADLAGTPAAWVGEVTEVRRVTRRVTVVHLESGMPFSYRAGQSLPVSSNYLPGIWRMLTPATPPNEYGTLELHVRLVDEGRASPFLATPRPGDLWSFGAGRGSVDLPEGPCILLAYGTGLAAAKALILQRLGTRRAPVHLIMAAEYPAEIYDWELMSTLASQLDWLTVTPVSRHGHNRWSLRATSPGPVPEIGGSIAELVDTYLSPARLGDREVMVLGPAAEVDATIVRLSFRGVAWSRITMLRYDEGVPWPEPL